MYPAGTWFVKMKWYEMKVFREHGPREYQLAVQYPALVWPVESLVRCGGVEFDGHGSCSLTACTRGSWTTAFSSELLACVEVEYPAINLTQTYSCHANSRCN